MTVVVDDTGWVFARIDDGLLKVSSSPLAKRVPELLDPVNAIVHGNCTSHLITTKHKDEWWFFGTRIDEEYIVYGNCPGPSQPHDCCNVVQPC